jgi:Mg2+-importing ATPase
MATTMAVMAFGIWLPYSPLASALGFTQLPRMYWPILMLTLLSYLGLTQIIKVWLLRKQWIQAEERASGELSAITCRTVSFS